MNKKLLLLLCIVGLFTACSNYADINTESKPISGKHYTLQELEPMTYKFKVVFHFLQNNKSELSAVHTTHLQTIIDAINNFYVGNTNETNTKVVFELADNAPQGKTLSEKGITRYNITEDSISYNALINEKPGDKFYDMGWDRANYINIYVYTTKEKNIGGVSTLPKMPKSVAKDGDIVASGNEYTSYNVSVTLQKALLGLWLKAEKKYPNTSPAKVIPSDSNPVNVLAHELGHYLGLYHVFHTKEADNDYCEDTKEYDRNEYMKRVDAAQPTIDAAIKAGDAKAYYAAIDPLFMRTPMNGGSSFRSVNIMDYYYTDANKFTADQVKRIRRHLYYSTTIPGPKVYLGTGSRATITAPSKPYIII